MANTLTQPKTIEVKSIAPHGVEHLQKSGAKIEKSNVEVEPCEDYLKIHPHTQGLSRVTFPAGTQEQYIEGAVHWLTPNGSIFAYRDDGYPNEYVYGGRNRWYSQGFPEWGPQLTTLEQSPASYWRKEIFG